MKTIQYNPKLKKMNQYDLHRSIKEFVGNERMTLEVGQQKLAWELVKFECMRQKVNIQNFTMPVVNVLTIVVEDAVEAIPFTIDFNERTKTKKKRRRRKHQVA